MHMLAVVEVCRRCAVVHVVGAAGAAVVVGLLVGPIHAALVAGLQPPSLFAEERVEGPQPVELHVQRLVMVLGLAVATVVVGGLCQRVAIGLLLHATAIHMAGAEGGVHRQLLVLAVELLCVEHVERVVDVAVVARALLVVVQRVVAVQHVHRRDVAVATAVAATQLVAEQQAVLVVKVIFAAHLHAAHVVGVDAKLVDVVVRPRVAVVVEVFDVGVRLVAALTDAAVHIEEKVVLLRRVVEAHVAHHRGDELRLVLGYHERQRSTGVEVHHTVEAQRSGGLVLELYVDDAAHALGVILGRGVCDDLHVLHRRGGYLLQQGGQVAGQ